MSDGTAVASPPVLALPPQDGGGSMAAAKAMAAAAAFFLLGCRAASVAPAPAVTLSDSKLSATLGGGAQKGLGQLTERKTPTGANVIDPGSPGPKRYFVRPPGDEMS